MRAVRRSLLLLAVVALPLGCALSVGRGRDAGADARTAEGGARDARLDAVVPPDDAGLDAYDSAVEPGHDASAPDVAAAEDVAVRDSAPPTVDAADPPTGPVERSYKVLHWNVAGAVIHNGRTDTGLIPTLLGAIRDSDAQLVGLNEVCRSQFDALESRLRASGWPRDPQNFARFAESRGGGTTPPSCGAFGNAIFSRPALGAAARFELPSDGTVEGRWLVCAPLSELGHMRFCTTHLTPRIADGHNLRQLREVFRRLEAYRTAGDTVIVTGDFNTEPNAGSMDAVYAAAVDTPNNRGNAGEYRELDDDDPAHCRGYGEATGEHATGGACGAGRKIDYIFVRRDRVVREPDAPQAESHPVTRGCTAPGTNLCADHRRLTGRVTVRVER